MLLNQEGRVCIGIPSFWLSASYGHTNQGAITTGSAKAWLNITFTKLGPTLQALYDGYCLRPSGWLPRRLGIQCHEKKFCKNLNMNNEMTCYGSSDGCRWSQNDCDDDGDCLAIAETPSYTNNITCKDNHSPLYWGASLCDDF